MSLQEADCKRKEKADFSTAVQAIFKDGTPEAGILSGTLA